MSKRTILIFVCSAALFALGFGVLHVITEREIAKIPEAQRREMSDFDWIGFDDAAPWCGPPFVLAFLIGIVGVVSAGFDYHEAIRRT